MSGAWKWVSVLAVAVVGLLLFGSGASGMASAAKPNTTYTVTFYESGLVAGTTWSVEFNSATYSSSTSAISISGVSATNYYWYIPTNPTNAGAQYVGTPTNGYIDVNYQLTQYIVFQKQWDVAFTVLPSTSDGTTNPQTGYFNVGSTIPIVATPQVGFVFSKWSVSTKSLAIANAGDSSTFLTVGATGTVTAHFLAVKTKVTFTEQGLPANALALGWSVMFGGSPATSSTTKVVSGSLGVGYYSWSISPVGVGSGIEYAAVPSSGSVNLPEVSTIDIQFVEQYQVTFSVSTSGTGTGSISPSGTFWYRAGSEVNLTSTASSGSLFQSWSAPTALYLGSTSVSSTNITVQASGTVTATFKSGTQCNPSGSPSNCKITFTENGLPSGTAWMVEWNSVYYSSSTSTITVSHVTGGAYAYPEDPVGTASSTTTYYAQSSYYYVSVPGQVSIQVSYVPYYYVTFQTAGSGSSSSYIVSYSSGWYEEKQVIPLNAEPSAYATFTSWSSSAKGLAISGATKASAFLTIGGAGTITATFTAPSNTVQFVQRGLPVGTAWGVELSSQYYFSTGWELNVTGVPSSSSINAVPLNGISTGNSGVEYQANWYSSYLNVPNEHNETFVYSQYVLVQVTQTGGGSTNPSSTSWYLNGTTIAIAGINSSSVSFKSWSASPSSAVVFGATNQASTTAALSGPSVITAKFA